MNTPTNLKEYNNIKLRGSTKASLGFVYSTAFFVMSVLILLGTFNAIWLQYFHNATLLTIINALTIVSGSLFRIPFGALTHKDGGKLPTVILLGAVVVGFLMIDILLFTVQDPKHNMIKFYAVFVIASFLIGFGANYLSVGTSQVTYWVKTKKHLGLIVSLFLCFTMLGFGVINIAFGGYINNLIAPQWSFLIFLIIYALCLVGQIFLPLVPPVFVLKNKNIDHHEAVNHAKKMGHVFFPPATSNVMKNIHKIWKNPKLVALVMFSFFLLGSLFVTLGWTPYVLLTQFNLSTVRSYTWMFIVLAAGMVSCFTMGFLVRKTNLIPILFIVCALFIFAGTIILVTNGNKLWAQLLGNFLLMDFGAACLLVMFNWSVHIDPELSAITFGWITGIGGTFGGILAIIGSLFVDGLAKTNSLRYEYLYWFLVGAGIITFIIYGIVFVPDIFKTHFKKIKLPISTKKSYS